MNITINGKKEELQLASPTVAMLLKTYALDGKAVIIERNGEIVSKAELDTTPIADGDRIEIVHFVGGG
ncbi:sulfur carrier protein ThiS [Bacillus sp. REN10]|uniref:sulfur carrier protein ThiS n=1 Tax=Bacillus sp. REN10 TaxID=2782541 RepID=UPI00193C6B26|nr:sulfur carrier protein ThiS [Bacillus sp. REN10]